MLVFCDYPGSVVEVVYVLLYKAFCHASGLYLCIKGTVFNFRAVIYGILVVGVFMTALYYPISVCDLAHSILV